jgi:hypothetical protein
MIAVPATAAAPFRPPSQDTRAWNEITHPRHAGGTCNPAIIWPVGFHNSATSLDLGLLRGSLILVD